MKYNIVTNFKINQMFKSGSKYYQVSLGLVSTMDSNRGVRVFNENDKFAYFYNTLYNTTIYGQGNIGNFKFYTDHYIKEDKIAIYYDEEEFVFDLDESIIREKGVDFYLGRLIKNIEEEREKESVVDKSASDKPIIADPNKIFTNPGAVNYQDLKAYLEKQNSDRI